MPVRIYDRLFIGIIGQVSLEGVIEASSTLSGTLLGNGAMVGSITAQSTIQGTLTNNSLSQIVGSIAGTGTFTGTMSDATAGAMVGPMTAQAIFSGTLSNVGDDILRFEIFSLDSLLANDPLSIQVYEEELI